jgi:adenylyl- and sulfurtransferase ThiI
MITLVLLSGGLDSAVLAAHEAQKGCVLPVYVSVGLAWEDAEVAMVERLLASPAMQSASSRCRAYRSRCVTCTRRHIGRSAACRPRMTHPMKTSTSPDATSSY